MARKIVKKKTRVIKLLKIDGDRWDGYRGNKDIVWQGVYNESGFMIEEFGVRCGCGRWYGWIEGIYNAKTLSREMKSKGCNHCKKGKKRSRK